MHSGVRLDASPAGSRLPALAWSLLAATLAASVAAVVLALMVRPHPDADVGFSLGQAMLGVGYAGIGAVVASRAARNVCGWILIAIGSFQAISNLGFMLGLAAGQTAESPSGLTGALVWVSNWIWFPSLMLLATFLPLLFPDGHLPSRRWRWFAALSGALLVSGTTSSAVATWLFMYRSRDVGGGWWEPALFAGLLVAGVGSVASLFARYRRWAGVQRQQLKVIGLGGTAAIAGILATFGPGTLLWVALTLLLALPAAVGAAILRYRLFDIDRIISRTVAYVLLTGLLAGVYAGGVFLLRPAVSQVTGESTLSVAISTIAVAALFRPARRRIQSLVDRRFNRARYEASLVVGAFSSRLRDQVELQQLRTELLDVVARSVAPSGVALWLKDDAGAAAVR